MSFVCPLLLSIAALTASAAQERYPEAKEAYRCLFDAKSDVNYDSWPDNWTRQRGQGYPNYVKIHIVEEQSPTSKFSLRFDMDGGAAVAFSEPIAIGPLYSYQLESYVNAENLEHDRAFISLTFLDGDKQRIRTVNGGEVKNTKGWTLVRLGPVISPTQETRFVVIGLHVEPREGEDLKAKVLFSDVWLGRLPRLGLKSNQSFNIVTLPEKPELTCFGSGFQERNPVVTFELYDVENKRLSSEAVSLSPQQEETEITLSENDPEGVVYFGKWRPPISRPGFYRVRAEIVRKDKRICTREFTIAAIEQRKATSGSSSGGTFGWSLPQGAHPIPMSALPAVLSQVGVSWIKYPVWVDEQNDGDSLERLSEFIERLNYQGIETAGMLFNPPEALRRRYGQGDKLTAAETFAPAAEVWYPTLEPILVRLANQIRWWQLGSDEDESFCNSSQAISLLTKVRETLSKAIEDVRLGIAWNWLEYFPSEAGSALLPYQFLALTAGPPLTANELGLYLDATEGAPMRRWVVLQPLSKKEYDLRTRAEDLVRRMIAAKMHGADAVFCTDPFDLDHGLLNEDGTPDELLLPWRTAATELSGAKYLGCLALPNGSKNLVFSRDRDAVMVVWNEASVDETLYLGKKIKQIDLWGRPLSEDDNQDGQIIHVGRTPTFVTGLNQDITELSMSVQFEKTQMPSIFGVPHENSISFQNSFPQGASGKVSFELAKGWQINPAEFSFRTSANEEWKQPIKLTLPFTASSGRQEVRIDFNVLAGERYQFSVYRHIDVGLGDVYFELQTHLNDRGELEIEQRFVNETKKIVSFRCELFAPDRKRIKFDILNVGRGNDVKIYRIPEGRELLGKTLWLRAEELNGPRIMNYRFPAQP